MMFIIGFILGVLVGLFIMSIVVIIGLEEYKRENRTNI